MFLWLKIWRNIIKPNNGHSTGYIYDALSRVRHADQGKEQYLYDAMGNLIAYQDPASAVTRYQYDSLNRPVRKLDPTGGQWRYGYNDHGVLITQRDPMGNTTVMKANLHGDLTEKTLPGRGCSITNTMEEAA